jgi:hypothetical protein
MRRKIIVSPEIFKAFEAIRQHLQEMNHEPVLVKLVFSDGIDGCMELTGHVQGDADKDYDVKKANLIIELISNVLGVTYDEMRSANRVTRILDARQIAMYCLRTMTGLSLKRTGDYFKKDHTTVINSVQVVSDMINCTDNRVTDKLVRVMNAVNDKADTQQEAEWIEMANPKRRHSREHGKYSNRSPYGIATKYLNA